MLQAKAEAQESEKQYDLALNSFESVLRIEPRRPGVHYRMGRVCLARFEELHDFKDRDRAADQFRAEFAIDPGNGNAAYELAGIQYHLGNFEEARDQFESLIEHRPEFEQARVGLGGILSKIEKPGEAAIQLKRAIELDPNDEVAWYRLATALRLTGDQQGQNRRRPSSSASTPSKAAVSPAPESSPKAAKSPASNWKRPLSHRR